MERAELQGWGRVPGRRRGGPCTCPDTPPADEVCKHAIAATIAHAKASPCSGCGCRVARRELVEVHEDNDGMVFYEGDLVCLVCARNHGVL